MTTKTTRKVVRFDESKCDGCGLCVPACAEGAIRIIDGKARLVSERYCDGLGACLGECPQGAIIIEERVAEDFDEEAVKQHLEVAQANEERLPCGCPSSSVTELERHETLDSRPATSPAPLAMLRHWPVQLTLVPPKAPFLQGADLLLTADCVPFAYPGFHQDFLDGHSLLVACPKLDDASAHMRKLADILRQSDVKSLTVLHMEVPCCFGLVALAKQALKVSGKDIPFGEVTIGVKGNVKEAVR